MIQRQFLEFLLTEVGEKLKVELLEETELAKYAEQYIIPTYVGALDHQIHISSAASHGGPGLLAYVSILKDIDYSRHRLFLIFTSVTVNDAEFQAMNIPQQLKQGLSQVSGQDTTVYAVLYKEITTQAGRESEMNQEAVFAQKFTNAQDAINEAIKFLGVSLANIKKLRVAILGYQMLRAGLTVQCDYTTDAPARKFRFTPMYIAVQSPETKVLDDLLQMVGRSFVMFRGLKRKRDNHFIKLLANENVVKVLTMYQLFEYMFAHDWSAEESTPATSTYSYRPTKSHKRLKHVDVKLKVIGVIKNKFNDIFGQEFASKEANTAVEELLSLTLTANNISIADLLGVSKDSLLGKSNKEKPTKESILGASGEIEESEASSDEDDDDDDGGGDARALDAGVGGEEETKRRGEKRSAAISGVEVDDKVDDEVDDEDDTDYIEAPSSHQLAPIAAMTIDVPAVATATDVPVLVSAFDDLSELLQATARIESGESVSCFTQRGPLTWHPQICSDAGELDDLLEAAQRMSLTLS